MTIDTAISKRFEELEEQSENLILCTDKTQFIEPLSWQQWATSAHHILQVAFGKNSPHFENFAAAYTNCNGHINRVGALRGIFLAAKADYDGGYAFSLQAQLSGEILADFVSLAKVALAEGAKDVAAVLACAALEDTLKRFAVMKELDVSDKDMQSVVNALKSKGLCHWRTKDPAGCDA